MLQTLPFVCKAFEVEVYEFGNTNQQTTETSNTTQTQFTLLMNERFKLTSLTRHH